MATAAKQSKSNGKASKVSSGTRAVAARTQKVAAQGKAPGKSASNGKAPAKKATAKKVSPKKATPRPTYPDNVKAIAEKARGYACPTSRQGPVAKQCQQVMQVLGDPRKALAEIGVSQKALKAYATGDGNKDVRAALRPLGKRCVDAGGAKQWCSGRPMAATIAAWLEE